MTIARASLLISTNQLREKLTNILWQRKLGNTIRVLDSSYDFDEQTDGCSEFYKKGHIPSSLYFNPRQCAESTQYIPFGLPDVNCFTDYLQSLGISHDTHVVTYDRMDTRAALRAWWTLKVYGVKNISVLDGGLKKWVRDGHAITTEEPEVERGDFKASFNDSLVRDFEFVKKLTEKNTQDKNTPQLVDARGSKRFNDTIQKETGEEKAHIPGSINIPYPTVFNDDGTFKSEEDLKKVFTNANVDLNRPLVSMCARGVTGCAISAAAELLGKPNAPLYYGSWYEWSRKIAK